MSDLLVAGGYHRLRVDGAQRPESAPQRGIHADAGGLSGGGDLLHRSALHGALDKG